MYIGFCRSSGDGALIHVPADSESRTSNNEDMGIMDVMAAVGLGGVRKSVETAITLTDRLGQKIILHLKNEIGPAGNRHITVFCPYWLINLTQYALLFKQGKR